MSIFTIALAEINLTLREKSAIVYMLALPIFLITVLGLALGGSFNQKVQVEDIKVGYTITDAQLQEPFTAFRKEVETAHFAFQKVSSLADGKKKVQETELTAVVEVGKQGLILYYADTLSDFSKSVIEGYLNGFSGEFQLMTTLNQLTPEKAASSPTIPQASTVTIATTGIAGKKAETSIQYYSIAVIAMMMLYGLLYGSSILSSEKRSHTLSRILMTPITKAQLFAGKLIGCISLQALFLAITMLYSRFVFDMNWGSYWLAVYGLFLLEMIGAVSLGLLFDGITKGNSRALASLFSVVITIFSAIGGAYFPISDTHTWKNISPVGYISTVIKQAVYQDNVSALLLPASVLLLISFGCIFGYGLLTRKREVL